MKKWSKKTLRAMSQGVQIQIEWRIKEYEKHMRQLKKWIAVEQEKLEAEQKREKAI